MRRTPLLPPAVLLVLFLATLIACSSDDPAGPGSGAAPDTTRLFVTLDYRGAFAVTDSTPVYWGVSTSAEAIDFASGGSFVLNATTDEIVLESKLGPFTSGSGTIYLAAWLDVFGSYAGDAPAAGCPIVVYDRTDPFATDLASRADGIAFAAGDSVRVTLMFDDSYTASATPSVFAVSQPQGMLCAGATLSLGVEALDELDRPYVQSPLWHSSDRSVAIVDETGQVTGLRPGEAGVFATLLGAMSDTCLVRVYDCEPVRVEINGDAPLLCLGDETALTATVTDSADQVLPMDVEWTSSEPSVATVDADGRLTALAAGTTDLVASVEGVASDPLTVTVEDCELAGLTITSWEPAPCMGDRVTFTAEAYDHDGQPLSRPVAWRSSDTALAFVDSTGSVTCVGAGTCRIYATVPSVGFDGEVYVDVVISDCGPVPAFTVGTTEGRGIYYMGDPRMIEVAGDEDAADLDVDLDGDGSVDFKLHLYLRDTESYGLEYRLSVWPRDESRFVAHDQAYDIPAAIQLLQYMTEVPCEFSWPEEYGRWAKALQEGDVLAEEPDWTSNPSMQFYRHQCGDTGSLEVGHWNPGDTGYVGLRMDVAGGAVWGWLRCRVEVDTSRTLYVDAWASRFVVD